MQISSIKQNYLTNFYAGLLSNYSSASYTNNVNESQETDSVTLSSEFRRRLTPWILKE